jgi:ATP-dependent DNA helicase RecQ
LSHVHDLLRRVFGFTCFRGLQEQVVDHVVAGGDALVLMPTGGGKSLCYQIPAIVRPGTGLVISPLIALMQDQVGALQRMGVAASCLNSAQDGEESRRACRALCRGELDLLYVSPERAVMSGFLDMLGSCRLSLIAIDEAHCVSQWGHDFRPEYLQLAELHRRFPDVPRIALTATADEPTRADILQRLELFQARKFISGFDRPNIQYLIHPKQEVRRQFLDFYRSHHPGEAGIVYCQTRARVDRAAGWLREDGLEALPYHAGMTTEERQRNQERFLHEEGVVMVATVAFGMGIDKPNVRFVAHLDMPKSVEAYYQETGRAGRDGLPATAWMAYGLADVMGILQLMSRSQAPPERRALERRKLDAMLGFCETAGCRRQVLLRYFGEELPERCGNCDTCLHPVAMVDGTIAAQMALSCVKRTGERYGVGYLVDVLLGRDNPRIQKAGHDRLPTFGVGRDSSAREWSSVFRQLAAAGLVEVDMEGYGGLRLTPASWEVLKGRRKFSLRRDPAVTRQRARKKALSVPPPAVASDLFEALRRKRLELARQERIPPYLIFHDTTLLAMVQSRPTTLEEMAEVPGVGEVKLARYGQIFLGVLLSA